MTPNSLKKNAFEYMTRKALADKSKALVSFDLLLDNPAGIGDHSTDDFYKNLDEALNTLVDAEDRLEMLDELRERHFDMPDEGPPPF